MSKLQSEKTGKSRGKKPVNELNRPAAAAEAPNKNESVILANMSQEIMASVNKIIGFAELAQFEDIPPKTREYLNNVSESAKLLLGTISDIPAIDNSEKPAFEGEILICDDDNLNQLVICDYLARLGIITMVAQNGREAVDIILQRVKNGEKQFDLIFMDIYMPEMDGIEAAYKIAELKVKTPIIALTSNIMPSDLELYKASGMAGFLGKPFTPQELWECLEKHLSTKSYAAVSICSQSEDDEKMKKLLMINFAKENQDTHAEITRALDSGDIKLAHRLAHSLKSNAGQIGEKQLQAAAAKVEAMLSDGKTQLKKNPFTKKLISALEAELKSVLDKLAPLLLNEKNNTNKVIAVDAEMVLELFGKLEPMLKNRDTESLYLLDLIRTVPGMEELAYQIEGYKFKQAAETLESLKNEGSAWAS